MSCEFYKHDGSFWSNSHFCLKKNDNVSTETYQRYCSGYDYRDCPIFKDGSSFGCYLTSACVTAKDLPDDCEELETLREFRDNWLKAQECGECLIKRYYEVAPKIVEEIDKTENRLEIYEELYEKMVKPCVSFVQKGEYAKALELYQDTTESLEKRFC